MKESKTWNNKINFFERKRNENSKMYIIMSIKSKKTGKKKYFIDFK